MTIAIITDSSADLPMSPVIGTHSGEGAILLTF
jgi:fatty acid-binding protein DegV